MLHFALAPLTAIVFVSAVATSDTDGGVRKQVRVTPNGVIAAGGGNDAVRRQTRPTQPSGLNEFDKLTSEKVYQLTSEKVQVGYTMHTGLDCVTGQEVANLETGPKPSGLTLSECQSRCTSDERCGCLNFANATGTCSMLKYCVPEQCSSASLADLYVQSTIYVVDGVSYRRAGGWTCEASSGATMIDSDASAKVNITPTQCLRECNQDASCSCTRYSRYYGMKCWKMRGCPSQGHRLHQCDRSNNLDTYIREDASVPTPASVPTAPPTLPPTLPELPSTPTAPYVLFGTDVYCYVTGSPNPQRLTHRHGQTPAGTYASQAACEALCDSASECKFYQWRHDESAMSKYTCSTFYACDDPRPYKDGDGGHVWKKSTAPILRTDQNGFVDLGMGRCGVCGAKGSGQLCRDPGHIHKPGEAANCAAICGGNNHQCYGYSTTTTGDCWLWMEKDLRFGGDLIGWEGSHCNVKACVPNDSCPVCQDAAGWTNGHHMGCHSYQVHFCAGGAVKEGNGGWAGDGMKNPEKNCCACGGGVFQ